MGKIEPHVAFPSACLILHVPPKLWYLYTFVHEEKVSLSYLGNLHVHACQMREKGQRFVSCIPGDLNFRASGGRMITGRIRQGAEQMAHYASKHRELE